MNTRTKRSAHRVIVPAVVMLSISCNVESVERSSVADQLGVPPWIPARIQQETGVPVDADMTFRNDLSARGVLIDWIYRVEIVGTDGIRTGVYRVSFSIPASEVRHGGGLFVFYDVETGNQIGSPIRTVQNPQIIVDIDHNVHIDRRPQMMLSFKTRRDRDNSTRIMNYSIVVDELTAIREAVRNVSVGSTIAKVSERFGLEVRACHAVDPAEEVARIDFVPATSRDVIFDRSEDQLRSRKSFVVRAAATTQSEKTIEMLWRGVLYEKESVEEIQVMAFKLELIAAYER